MIVHTFVCIKTHKELVPINAEQQINSDVETLAKMAYIEKAYATNRARSLGYIVFGFVAIVLIVLGIVLGVTGVFTAFGAFSLAVFGGIIGGTAVGIFSSRMFYVINMWNSIDWRSL